MPTPDANANTSAISFAAAQPADLEALISIRIAAMRASLEQAGRFDPIRVRERFQSGFVAAATRFILYQGQRAGFVALKNQGDHWLLDHLYILPAHQARGIGAAVLASVFAEADAAAMSVRVGALKGSASNRFYQRHGFVQTAEGEWDIYYLRAPQP